LATGAQDAILPHKAQVPSSHSEGNAPMTYTVLVDDNFNYMDESERYTLGEFADCESR
jgi:hypothetical protein